MIKSSFTMPGGRSLNYYTSGHGKPLVCLHGWAMSSAVFKEMAALLEDDFQLFIPDLPGHGESDPPRQCDLKVYAEVLSLWLQETVPGPFAVLGWSLGGMLALELAQDKQLAVEKLILVATTPQFTCSEDWTHGLPATQVRALSRNLGRRFETTLGEFFALSFAGEDISSERIREIRRFAVFNNPLPDKNTAQACLDILAQQDQRQVLSGISQPCLVIHGRLDEIAPVAAGRALAEALAQGRFVEFTDVSHGPFLSRPEAVADEVRRFC